MIRAYVVEHDLGFAPNPFHGVCTLATCKPEIRAHATTGDWVVGVGSKNDGGRGRMVFAMQVDKGMTFQEYWDDDNFQAKKPNFYGSLMQAQGDNIYHKVDGLWVQEPSRHTHSNPEMTARHKERDTSRDAVLISKRFVYYGADAIEIPTYLAAADGRRLCLDGTGTPKGGLQRNINLDEAALTNRFEDWLEQVGVWGRVGEPCEWRKDNQIKAMLTQETFSNG